MSRSLLLCLEVVKKNRYFIPKLDWGFSKVAKPIVTLLGDNLAYNAVHLFTQPNNDVAAICDFLGNDDLEAARGAVYTHHGLVAEQSVIWSTHVDDADGDLGGKNFVACRVFDQKGDIAYSPHAISLLLFFLIFLVCLFCRYFFSTFHPFGQDPDGGGKQR